jgi:hypothetical protein
MPDDTRAEIRLIGSEEIAVKSQATGIGSNDLPSRRLRHWAYAGFFAFSILGWAALVWLVYIWLTS